MNTVLLNALLELVKALVTAQVNRQGQKISAQGFISIDEATKTAEEDEKNFDEAKKHLADMFGVPVENIDLTL